MEAQRSREGPNGREGRRATVCFMVLIFALSLAFFFVLDVETLMQSVGCLTAAFYAFFLMRRASAGTRENVQRIWSGTSALFTVLTTLFLSALLVFLFNFLLEDVWLALVPVAVSGLVQGVLQGSCFGIFIHYLSSYSGSYWLNQEEQKETLRSLKIATMVVVSLVLVVVFIYVAVEYILGPIVRVFA